MTQRRASGAWKWVGLAGGVLALATGLGFGLPWVRSAEQEVRTHDADPLAHEPMRVGELEKQNAIHQSLLKRIESGDQAIKESLDAQRDALDAQRDELKVQRTELLYIMRQVYHALPQLNDSGKGVGR